MPLVGEGGAEEGEHAIASDVGERGEFQGVVAAVEAERAEGGTVAAEGIEHLAGEFGEHGGVVLAVDHEAVAAGAHAALDVRHGADGCPVVAKFLHGDVVAKALPDVVGSHALADDVGVISGNVEEAAGADGAVVHQRDVADGGADARAEDAEFGVTLLLEPPEAAARVENGLAVGVESEADVGAANLVGAFVAARHAAIVVRQAQF